MKQRPVMAPRKLNALMVLVFFAIRAASAGDEPFKLDPDRPFVYLRFDHSGKGSPRRSDESKDRIWLRLVNNCKMTISVRTFGMPNEGPKDETGVMLAVVATPPEMITSEEPLIPSDSTPKEDEMPPGYISEVGSSLTIRPGKDILFSFPRNSLGKLWHVEIPFSFDLPSGPAPRPVNVSSTEPQMSVAYFPYDIPNKVKRISKN